MKSKNPEPVGPSPEPGNDAIIGKAFRWSLAVVLVSLLVILTTLYFVRSPPPELPTVNDASIQAPQIPQPIPVQPPTVTFTDITEAAGIDFVHVNGAEGQKLLPETMGGGVAFLDYDNDGHPDLLFINSGPWNASLHPNSQHSIAELYRNDGTGQFQNVTRASGLAVAGYGMGVAIGDYDNDGWVDVFITAVGSNHLFRNVQGRFVEVTAEAGVAGGADVWSTASAFFDYDNDGDLDLFVANYVQWSKELDLELGFQLTGIGRAYGPPTTFAGSHGYLYRNEGEGSFTDVSLASGIQITHPLTGEPVAKALAAIPVDFDQDGWMDLFVANDTVRNFLFHNQGNGQFEEVGVMAGVAFDRDGNATGAMGTDVAHFRNDGEIGFAVGNFANEMTSLYVTQGNSDQFADEAITEGLGATTRQVLTFGLFFFDYDLDGWLDLFQANGHLEEAINIVQPSQHYAQAPQLFWNCALRCQQATFVAVPLNPGEALATPLVARGASYADIDNDGDLDIIITQVGGQPMLLRNDQQLGHHWLRVKLVGKRANRDGIGAWVEIRAGGNHQRRPVTPSRSYLSQTEMPVTFGLGQFATVDSLRVEWPDGSTQELHGIAANRLLVIEQSPSAPEPIEAKTAHINPNAMVSP
ncbi:MAG: CRTAC1 family protein [Gammaproteobacteria bacterium]